MHELTKLIYEDMKPALGVTEPGAIAYAVSLAKSHTKGAVRQVTLKLNSGMYKNAFTCGIPGSSELGNYHAAALGAVGADPAKKLECLRGITSEQSQAAAKMVTDGLISVEMTEITSRIYIEAIVITECWSASVIIRDAHTNVVKITENGKAVFENASVEQHEEISAADASAANDSSSERTACVSADAASAAAPAIHRYILDELHQYSLTVPIAEIGFIHKAFDMNMALCRAGIESDKTTFAGYLLKKNGGRLISDDEQKTASLLCNAAIEARVLGLPDPAMSITGSGAHGIIATLPLYAACKVNGYSDESLLRAAALSYLVCMYIKEYSGKLSAFCGCAIAAGTGMACGLILLRGGSSEMMAHTINNMASSITGMICDGGNQGCTMKGIAAVDAAWQSADAAMNGVYIYDVHGINGHTPEATMRNIGLIASPGMVGTEKTIIDILKSKSLS